MSRVDNISGSRNVTLRTAGDRPNAHLRCRERRFNPSRSALSFQCDNRECKQAGVENKSKREDCLTW